MKSEKSLQFLNRNLWSQRTLISTQVPRNTEILTSRCNAFLLGFLSLSVLCFLSFLMERRNFSRCESRTRPAVVILSLDQHQGWLTCNDFCSVCASVTPFGVFTILIASDTQPKNVPLKALSEESMSACPFSFSSVPFRPWRNFSRWNYFDCTSKWVSKTGKSWIFSIMSFCQ